MNIEIRKADLIDIFIMNEIYEEGTIFEMLNQFDNMTEKEILFDLEKNKKKRIQGFKMGIKSKKEIWFVALNFEKVIGFAQAKIENDKDRIAEMEKLYVSSEYRGNGIGKKLSLKLIEELKKKKVKKVISKILSKNICSIGLHEKLGFETISLNMEKRI